ncbi:MAG: hypothetical protein AB2L24_29470 [Mangrovibacterium sp.]
MEKSIIKSDLIVKGNLKIQSESGNLIATIPVLDDPEYTLLKTNVHGNRMFPTLKDGDQVILRKVNPYAFIEWGEVFLIQVDDQQIFCRLVPTDKNGVVRASYDNPDDRITQDVQLSSISSIWKLKATARLN